MEWLVDVVTSLVARERNGLIVLGDRAEGSGGHVVELNDGRMVLDYFLSKGRFFRPHSHPGTVETLELLSGSIFVRHEDRPPDSPEAIRHLSKPGDQVRFEPGEPHSCFAGTDARYLVIFEPPMRLEGVETEGRTIDKRGG